MPTVRKTWAPRGHTPIYRHWYRHDRISAISGISVSPTRRRLGLYCLLYDTNIHREEVIQFLRHLLRHLRGHVMVLLDNGPVHRGQPLADLCRRIPRLHLEPFPSYAPEINPDEGVWSYLKGALSNGRPDTLGELMDDLTRELHRLAHSQRLLRGCIEQSDLPPFLP